MNPKVDGYIRKNKKWQEELTALRKIILDRGLVEEVKWRVPCYTFGGRNVIVLGAFKEWCGISFIKGVLLKDRKGILTKPGENSQSVRLVRFTHARDIAKLEKILKAYIDEAVELEKSGAKVKLKKISERKVPEELQKKLDEDPELKAAFNSLTPGRQRMYFMYFSGAKQAQTRESRVEKCIPRILDGKGLND